VKQVGPNQWFCLWHPPGWRVESGPAGLNLVAPDDGGVLSLQAIWNPTQRTKNLRKIFEPRTLFGRVRGVRESPGPGWGDSSLQLQGEGVPGPRPSIFRRWLERPRWRRWTLWGACQQQLDLMAVFLCSDPIDHEAVTIAALIVDSLCLRPTLAEPAPLFTERVVGLLRERFPGATCEALGELRVRIDDSVVSLANSYRQYQLFPEQFDEALLPTVESITLSRRWTIDRDPPALDEVRERILPMLYPESVWRQMLGESVASPWIARMVVLYVVDEPHSYWFIRRDLLAGWGLTPERLHGLALRNLELHFEANPMEITIAGEPDGPRLLLPNRPDAFNATRLLSETFLEKLRNELGSPLAVGVPSRDLLVAISLHDQQAVEHVRVRVANDFGVMDHPLCQQLLLITRDGVSRYSSDSDDVLDDSGDRSDTNSFDSEGFDGGDSESGGVDPEGPGWDGLDQDNSGTDGSR